MRFKYIIKNGLTPNLVNKLFQMFVKHNCIHFIISRPIIKSYFCSFFLTNLLFYNFLKIIFFSTFG